MLTINAPSQQVPTYERVNIRVTVKPAKDVIIAHIALIAFFSYSGLVCSSLKWPCFFVAGVYTASLYRRLQTKQMVISVLQEIHSINLSPKAPQNLILIHQVANKTLLKAPGVSPQAFSPYLEMAKMAYLMEHGKIILHPTHAKKND
jgi:ABC-type uncharacterized transport system permease subunit